MGVWARGEAQAGSSLTLLDTAWSLLRSSSLALRLRWCAARRWPLEPLAPREPVTYRMSACTEAAIHLRNASSVAWSVEPYGSMEKGPTLWGCGGGPEAKAGDRH